MQALVHLRICCAFGVHIYTDKTMFQTCASVYFEEHRDKHCHVVTHIKVKAALQNYFLNFMCTIYSTSI